MSKEHYVDALIVGAGFAGICQLYHLQNLGLKTKLIESLPDLGGTWYSNVYPGALSDTESHVYRFSWDHEDLQTYPWGRRYLRQPEILAYLRHVVHKNNLREHMRFGLELVSATWKDEAGWWQVETGTGDIFYARYLLPALGVISKAYTPALPGASSFKGDIIHTAQWPEGLELDGKVVGIVGCGSSGVQIATAITPRVAKLKHFIRSAQWVIPSGDHEITPSHRQWVNKHYDEIYEDLRKSFSGFGFKESNQTIMSVSPDERNRTLEDLWKRGNGARFMSEGFCDIVVDEEANDLVCQFLRQKIEAIVQDDETAQKLIPDEPFARRPICCDGYYDIYNKSHVSIVDTKQAPIREIVGEGIKTADGVIHPLEVIVLATGFDTSEGNLMKVAIRGRGGQTLAHAWKDGPRTFLGAFAAGFPNLFLVNGPMGPFGNVPPAIEASVELITGAIAKAEELRVKENASSCVIESSFTAQQDWSDLCHKLAQNTLFTMTKNWLFGANIPGKPVGTRVFFGGIGGFRKAIAEMQADGWRGLSFSVWKPSKD